MTRLLRTLDQQLDRRLVGTFLSTLIAIVQWRNHAHGLLLAELGADILTPEQAPAGTKRLRNLLRSSRWKAKLLADWLWQQADARFQALRASEWQELRSWLLRVWCHRTGKRSREVAAPLYRLRSALSRLWQAYLPSPGRLRLNSG